MEVKAPSRGSGGRQIKSHLSSGRDGAPSCAIAMQSSDRSSSTTWRTPSAPSNCQAPYVRPSDQYSVGPPAERLGDIGATPDAAVHDSYGVIGPEYALDHDGQGRERLQPLQVGP